MDDKLPCGPREVDERTTLAEGPVYYDLERDRAAGRLGNVRLDDSRDETVATVLLVCITIAGVEG